ncbi:MAG: DUF2062 domain-containing protein [Cyanothece sp. SIO2G6]|nr:DUF2062 domain-containing protein [Cyanothece sp. SIO2G6]
MDPISKYQQRRRRHNATPKRVLPQNGWKRRLRYFYLRFVRLRGSPEAIATGVATGVFAGWFPLFGLQTIIGIALATIFKGNKLMAAAGTWVSNPLTYIPIYYFNFRVGQQLLAGVGMQTELPDWTVVQAIVVESGWAAFSQLMALGGIVSAALFLGCCVVGLVSAIAAYFLTLWLLRFQRQKVQCTKTRIS